ncbi:MAG: hypothetical protein MI863_07705 [Desulfobacterales bacterium]|nr:hypothetical protein [Desulfobacterales bacterium]
MNVLRIRSVSSILILLFLIQAVLPTLALAHKVVLFGWVEAGNIHIEAGFGGKKPAKNCVIKAFDMNQSLIHEGRTDDKGRYIFKVPSSFSSDMRLELDAGTGHKGSWTIQADEFTAVSGPESKPASPVEKGVDPFRILTGIAVIFGMAFLFKRIKEKSKGGNHD